MNRSELVRDVALELGMSENQVRKVVGATLDRIMGAVIEGEKVTLKGFGTFRRTWLPPRSSRHPESGRLNNLHPRYTCRFRVAENFHRDLKDLISTYDGDERHARARNIAHTLTTDLRLYHGDLVNQARHGGGNGELSALVEELRRRFQERVPVEVTRQRDYLEEELASLLPRRAIEHHAR